MTEEKRNWSRWAEYRQELRYAEWPVLVVLFDVARVVAVVGVAFVATLVVVELLK